MRASRAELLALLQKWDDSGRLCFFLPSEVPADARCGAFDLY